MTVSRRLEHERTHATTRRTLERRKFLIPRPGVRELVGYSLGRALERNPGVRLHAYVMHVNHSHGPVTDLPVEGDASALPDFFRDHHSLTARAMNARLGRGGPFWTTGSYDNVELHGRELTIEQQLLYAWTNVVRDGLCESPESWPGLIFLPEDWGKTFTFRKPDDGFFGGRRPEGLAPTDPDALAAWQAALRAEARDAERLGQERDRARRERERAKARKRARRGGRGCSEKQRRQLERARARRKKKVAAPKPDRASRSVLPELVTVTPVPPPGYEHMTLDEVKAHFRRLLDAEVERIHAERRGRGLTTFIGVERILREDPREPAGDSFPTFARNPRIACRDRETRLGLLRELQRWRAEVREKREKWRLGDREVVFPAGTYGMWALHGARVVGLVPYDSPSSPRPPPQAAA